MPCFTVQYADVDVSRYDAQVLAQALQSMGFRYVTAEDAKSFAASRLTTARAAELPAAYAEATIRTAAKRQGWQVKQDARNPRKFALMKA